MEFVACKSILFSNGGAFFFECDHDAICAALEGVTPTEVNIYITDYGLDLCFRNVIFPLQDNMLDHLARQPVLIAYSGAAEDYLLEPAYEMKVPPELILEARGALNFYRRTQQKTVSVI